MKAKLQTRIPDRIGLALSVVLFGVPAALLWLVTSKLIPFLTTQGWQPYLAWFAAGIIAIAPLLIAALVGAWLSAPTASLSKILLHLRVRRLTASDWRLTGLTLAVTLAAMGALQFLNANVWPGLSPHPPFMPVSAIEPAQYYILALWLPFFAVNIVGEELWWRGFIQPRQEPVFGSLTFVVQGVLHGAFHFNFGMGVLFILLPVVFSIPWAVQRSRNTSVGMLIHAGVNGPGFLAVTLGLLSPA